MKEHQFGEVRDLVTSYASFQPSGSQMGTVLSFPVFPEDIWQCFGILLDVTIVWGGLLLARKAAKHLPMHRTALYNKEISGPKSVRRATVGKPVLT